MRQLLLTVFTLAGLSTAAQVSVQSSADPVHLVVGDQTLVRLLVRFDEGVQIGQPLWPPPSDAYEFVFFEKWDTLDAQSVVIPARLAVWDSARVVVEGVGIPYRVGDVMDTAWSEPLELMVGFPTDSLFMKDIEEVAFEPVYWTDYLPHIVIGVVVVLVALLWWWLRRPAPQPVVPPTPKPQPHVVALERLRQLAEQNLWQRGFIKEYHSELTHILREYLERRFAIEALEATTNEIMAQLRQLGWSETWYQNLEQLLQTADMVKFAKARPPESFHEEAMKKVEAFILQTKPAPADEVAVAENSADGH